MVITEIVAGYVDKYKTEYTVEQLRNIQARGPNAGSAAEQEEYQAVNRLCERVGMHNEPIEHSDMEWVAGALKQRRENDKIKPCQGISAVTSIMAMLRGTCSSLGSLAKNRLAGKLHCWGWWGWPTLDGWSTCVVTDKSKLGDETQTVHSMHFGPAALGAWLAYRGPGNPYCEEMLI